MKITKVFPLAVLSLIFAPAVLADNGVYIGANYGKTSIDTGITSLTGGSSLDEKDSGLKIYVGYEINDNFSVEGHYGKLGEAVLTGSNGDGFTYEGRAFNFTQNNVVIKAETETYGVSGVFKLPISDAIAPFARVGIHQWDTKSQVQAGTGNVSLTNNGTDLFYGLGVSAAISESVDIRAEMERYKFGSDEVDHMSLGVSYGF